MAPRASGTSFFDQLFNANLHPVWSIRIMTAIALLCTATALWVVKSGSWHFFFLGADLGVLVGLFAQSCNTPASDNARVAQRSDVEDVRVTPV